MTKKTQKRQGRFFYGRKGPRSRCCSRQTQRGRKLRLEPLESRQLLDAGLGGELLGATTAPDLEWLTYVGGVERDYIEDVAIDANGNYLTCGEDLSNDEQPTYIAKFTSDGDHLWTTHFGDGGVTRCRLAVDGDGNVVATGTDIGESTWASGGYDTTKTKHDTFDAFVIKLNADGEHLWSTFTHESADSYRWGNDIAVDSAGDIFVVGWDDSLHPKVDDNGFVLKISADGQQPLWSRPIGGGSYDDLSGVTVDASDNVILVGETNSDNSSGWISGPFDNQYGGDEDVFVMKLNNDDGTTQWSSYLGGEGDDGGNNNQFVAVDAAGNILVASNTQSAGWVARNPADPVTWEQDGYDIDYGGNTDAFVAKFSPTGVGLWATYIGGDQGDRFPSIAVDAEGNALVAGITNSAGWVAGGWDNVLNDDGNTDTNDAFAVMVSPEGGHVWSSYLGGPNGESARGVAYDPAGYAVVAGVTTSPGLSTDGSTLSGTSDGFVAKIRLGPPAPPTPGVTVTPTAGLVTDESETTDSFDVVLNTQPAAPVTINMSSSDESEGVIEGSASLMFDAINWDVPQTVTVRGVDDGDLDGDQVYTIQLAAAVSTDPDYNGLDPADVAVTNLDDEAPPVPTEIYVWDIRFETQGVFTTIVVDVRQDSNLNGLADSDDDAAVGAQVRVDLYDSNGDFIDTLIGTTDSNGIFRSDTFKKLADGIRAEVFDLALIDFDWDPFDVLDPTLNDGDSDGDGLPDEVFVA